MKVGDTIVWSPDGGREHLYVVMTSPDKNRGNFVVFNLTRSKGGQKALTFNIGDHPYITRYPSDVNFGDGLIVEMRRIDFAISVGGAFPHEPMRIEMVKAIADFAKGHPAVSEDIELMIRNEWPD